MLNTKQIAPNFTLPDEKGNSHSLTDFLGKKVILYFYPKDNTSGCTRQAIGFKDLYPAFLDQNTVVIGISKDSAKSHQKFITNYELPFLLLSDETLEVIKMYDVYHEKKLYGKSYMGVVRTTYLIDEQGMIVYAAEKVNPTNNPANMLEIIKKAN